ncbi:chalcone isomerase family protein [bacterium]|nr:chalcone isomerase family protein [bacterium]
MQPRFDPNRLGQQPLVLELEYLRGVKGQLIAERSLKEMSRHGPIGDAQAERWLAEMTRIFPDVDAHDKLTGILQPGMGAIFLFNNQPHEQVADPEFARLFFSIWLGSNTSEPDMRAALLGERR